MRVVTLLCLVLAAEGFLSSIASAVAAARNSAGNLAGGLTTKYNALKQRAGGYIDRARTTVQGVANTAQSFADTAQNVLNTAQQIGNTATGLSNSYSTLKGEVAGSISAIKGQFTGAVGDAVNAYRTTRQSNIGLGTFARNGVTNLRAELSAGFSNAANKLSATVGGVSSVIDNAGTNFRAGYNSRVRTHSVPPPPPALPALPNGPAPAISAEQPQAQPQPQAS